MEVARMERQRDPGRVRNDASPYALRIPPQPGCSCDDKRFSPRSPWLNLSAFFSTSIFFVFFVALLRVLRVPAFDPASEIA
jgi:hypothetical protein